MIRTPAVTPPGALRRVDNATLRALVLGQISLHASMAGLRLALPLMMLKQGGWAGWPAELAAGVLLGLFAAAPVVLAVPAGRWADRRGYHKPVAAAVVMALLGGAVGCAAALLSPALSGAAATRFGGLAALQAVLLLVAATLIGTACNVGLIAMQRTAGKLAQGEVPPDQPPERSDAASAELRRVFSWLGIAPALGNVGGPLLAGVLIDGVGYVGACAALSLLPLGKSWWARRVPREASRAGAQQPDRGAPGTQAAAHPAPAGLPAARPRTLDLLAVPGIRRLLTVNWFFSSSWDLHGFVVPLLGHERGLSASAIGMVLGVFAASVAAVRVLIPLIAGRLQERQVLGGAMTVIALVFAVYPWAQTTLQMGVCAVVLGFALGSVQPMIMTALHHLAPPQRQGEAIALRSAIINLSSALLPMGFGLVGAALGASLLFRGMAVVLLCGLPLVARMPAQHH